MIVVMGNPRSGTSSVNAALQELGYNTLFFCPLVSNGDLSVNELMEATNSNEYNAVVSWRLTPYYIPLVGWHKVKKFLFCKRSVGWEASLLQFGFNYDKIQQLEEDFNESYEYLSREPEVKVGEFDISAMGYKELCEFLEVDTPNKEFPHSNKSEHFFQI